jgi:hypothetical protein
MLAAVSAATSAVGAGVSAYGALQQGRAAQREANYNARVQDNNAISAGYAAIQEQQNASREADAIREQRLRTLSSQRVAAAHSGISLTGSFNDLALDTSIQSEKDIQMALYKGQIGAYNQQGVAQNYRTQASLTRMAGANAKRSSYYQAAGTLLSGAAQAGSSYANFRKR